MKILYILHLFFASVLSMGQHEIPEVSAVTNYCISRDTNVANPTESDEPDGRKPSTPTDNTENKKPSPFLCFFQKRTNSIRRRKISYSSQTSQSSVHSRSSTSSDPATLTEETSSQTAEDLSPQTITSVQNPGYGIDSAPSPTKCAIPDNHFGYEPPRCNRVLPDIPCTSDANGRSASQLPMENQTSAPAETFYANSSNPQENDVFRSIFCFDVKPSSFIRENSRLEASSAKKNDLSLYCENDENNYVEMNPPNTDPIMAGQQLLINEYRETIPLPTQQTLNKIFDMVTSWKPKCIFFFGKLYLVPKFTSWRYSQSQLLKEIEKVIQTLNLCAKVNTAQSPNNEKYKWGHIDRLLTKILKSIEELIAMNQKLESLFSHINEHYANHIQYLIKNVSGSQPKTCVNSENTINSSRINLHSLVKDLAGLIKHEQDHINVSGVFKSDAELNKFTEALVEETVEICQRSKEIMDCSKNSTICDLEAYRSILLQLYQPLTEVLPCCVDIVTHVRFIAQQFTCLNQQLMCLGIETKSSSLGN